jgi:hypothetical protein
MAANLIESLLHTIDHSFEAERPEDEMARRIGVLGKRYHRFARPHRIAGLSPAHRLGPAQPLAGRFRIVGNAAFGLPERASGPIRAEWSDQPSIACLEAA